MAKIKEFIEYLSAEEYTGLFREACEKGWENIKDQYGDLDVRETIQEVHLAQKERTCDYSIKVEMEKDPHMKEYWLELDDTACGKLPIEPCWFVDAQKAVPGEKNDWIYERVFRQKLTEEEIQSIRPMLDICIGLLKGKNESLFQLGIMEGRGEKSVRLFTSELSKNDFLEYLRELKWEGNIEELEKWLTKLEPYAERKQFILDFDVFSRGISEKIGINFGTRNKKESTVTEFLDFLVKNKLCLESKAEDVKRWIQRYPSHTPFIENDISHFKLPFADGRVTDAKAYLRQGTIPYVEPLVYETPCLMNLELTTKCPLRCPQCYCTLEGGKDLPLELAEHWIREAEKAKVQTINLSGGETMCYPHIHEVVRSVAEKGMEPNIAVSGYRFTKSELEQFIQDGIGEICVSLNAPSREKNSLTRDGFDLAVRALEVLKEGRFPRTCINWVMHNSNADTFSEMLKLAEDYRVSAIAVMVFKPDAANQRKSLPTVEQMKTVSSVIKRYKGPVKIEIESCFSQMRALVGKTFFFNKNVGVTRGCGAGRDAVSITVDGEITPCRHIEIEENTKDLMEYWKTSSTVQKLRTVEERMEEPCSACSLRRNCLPCMAVNLKMNKALYMGENTCELWRD